MQTLTQKNGGSKFAADSGGGYVPMTCPLCNAGQIQVKYGSDDAVYIVNRLEEFGCHCEARAQRDAILQLAKVIPFNQAKEWPVDQADPYAPPPEASEWRFSTAADTEEKSGAITWAWKPWIPNGYVTLLVAKPKKGKSTIALWLLGRRYINGDPWPDGTECEGGKRLLIVETETGQQTHTENGKKFGIPLDRITWLFEDHMQAARLDKKEDREVLALAAATSEVGAILIDSLSGSHRQDETRAESADIMFWLADLAARIKKPIVVTHHLRKRGANADGVAMALSLDDIRGSSALTQTARSILALDNPSAAEPDRLRLHVLASNLAKLPDPLGVEIGDSGVTFTDAPVVMTQKKVQDKALDFLRAEIPESGQWVYARDVFTKGEQCGFTEDMLKKSKRKLGILSEQTRTGWMWRWPLDPGVSQNNGNSATSESGGAGMAG